MKQRAFLVPLLSVVLVTIVRAEDPTLRGSWRLNERSGATTIDNSLYHNNGSVLNAQHVSGFLDYGLRFAGSSSMVSIPHNASLNATDAVTIAGWVNGHLTTGLYEYKIVARKGSSYFLAINGNRIYGRVFTGTWRVSAGSTLLSDNEWHHLAMTYDRTQDGTPADLNSFNGLRSHNNNPMVLHGGPLDFDANLREIGNVLYDPEHPDPAKRYKIFYTGWQGSVYQQNITHIGMAYSPDGVHWTKFGNIIPERALEDPYVVKVDGVYYLFAEDKEDVPFRNVRRYHSPDCENWIDDGDVFDTQPGGNPPYWEGQDVSSIAVYIEDGIWYMFYEGRGQGGHAQIGLTTSADGLTWMRYSLDPIIRIAPPGAWDDNIVCPDDLIKIGDTYYFFYHGSGSATRNLSCAGMMTSTDLIHWSRYPYNPLAWTDGFVTLVDPSGVSAFQIGGDGNIGRWSPVRVCAPRLFVDGVEEPVYIVRDDSKNQSILTDPYPFSIGNFYAGGPYWFDGTVDEVKVYNRALSPIEIAQLWADRGIVPSGPPIGQAGEPQPIYYKTAFPP